MSHFTVLVIGDNVEKQLAPFNEQPEDGDPAVVLDFNDTTDEKRQQYADESTTWVRCEDGTLVLPWDERFRIAGTFAQVQAPAHLERVEIPFRERYATFEEFVREWHSEEPNAEGRYGYFSNPRAKWDWWVIGGRWTGYFKIKAGAGGKLGEGGTFHRLGMAEAPKGNVADSARKGDIDVDGMRDDAGAEAGAKYDRVHAVIAGRDWISWEQMRTIEHKGDIDAARTAYHAQPVVADLKTADILGWSEDLERYRVAREQFVATARAGAIATFAVLKDGQWYERGSMGWWGMVRDEKDEATWAREFGALIDSLPDDTLLTVVDCHI
jgi:hypothetical protein